MTGREVEQRWENEYGYVKVEGRVDEGRMSG